MGQNRHPSIADRPALPYTEAVLMEVQRYANIVPNGVQHVNSRDITVNGVTIPAHTMIQPLLTNLLKVLQLVDSFRVCQIILSEKQNQIEKLIIFVLVAKIFCKLVWPVGCRQICYFCIFCIFCTQT